MGEVLGRWGAPCILMHMQGTPKTMQARPSYDALIPELLAYFEETLRAWEDSGVAREKLLIDPGIGFGKTLRHNLCLLKGLREFTVLGRPIVLGTSRKSFIGAVLDRGAEERLAGTLATLVVGALNGAHVLRVHDVSAARDALTMAHAIRMA
jgi:dihydropteroate synthase